MRTRTQMFLITALLISVGAVTSYFFLTANDLLDGTEELDSRLVHDEEPPAYLPAAGEGFNVSFAVQGNDSTGEGAYVVTDVIVDDDFIVTNGADWRDDITEVMDGASGLLEQVGVEVRVGSVGFWVSADGASALLSLMDSAEAQTQRDRSRLLIVITCQDPSKNDGLAQRSSGRMIVEYYHQDQAKNSALLSHEVGHLFGAGHHEDAIECVGDGCIMDKRGYEHETEWCDHHADLIQRNVKAAVATTNAADQGQS